MVPEGSILRTSILRLCVHICAAVTLLEKVGVYHMDIKPANLVCAGAFGWKTPRLIDFGLTVISSRTYNDFRLSDLYLAPYTWPIHMTFFAKRDLSVNQRLLRQPCFRGLCPASFSAQEYERLAKFYQPVRKALRQRSQSNTSPLPIELFVRLRSVLRRCNLMQLSNVFSSRHILGRADPVVAYFVQRAMGPESKELDDDYIDYVALLHRAN